MDEISLFSIDSIVAKGTPFPTTIRALVSFIIVTMAFLLPLTRTRGEIRPGWSQRTDDVCNGVTKQFPLIFDLTPNLTKQTDLGSKMRLCFVLANMTFCGDFSAMFSFKTNTCFPIASVLCSKSILALFDSCHAMSSISRCKKLTF